MAFPQPRRGRSEQRNHLLLFVALDSLACVDRIVIEQANRALRLSPFDSLIYLRYIGLAYAHFAAGRFEEMVRGWRRRGSGW